MTSENLPLSCAFGFKKNDPVPEPFEVGLYTDDADSNKPDILLSQITEADVAAGRGPS